MSSPNPERVREALVYFDEAGGGVDPHSQEVAFDCLDSDQQLAITLAARAWLAGSSPDYEAGSSTYVTPSMLRRASSVFRCQFPNREGGT